MFHQTVDHVPSETTRISELHSQFDDKIADKLLYSNTAPLAMSPLPPLVLKADAGMGIAGMVELPQLPMTHRDAVAYRSDGWSRVIADVTDAGNSCGRVFGQYTDEFLCPLGTGSRLSQIWRSRLGSSRRAGAVVPTISCRGRPLPYRSPCLGVLSRYASGIISARFRGWSLGHGWNPQGDSPFGVSGVFSIRFREGV